MAQPTANAPFLQVNQVDVFYGPVQALFSVSMQVGRGEVVAVLGGNASGKSTTVKTVLGLVQPCQGTITFDGQRLNGKKTHQIVEMGVASIPEGRRIFPEMTVRENLLLGAYVRRQNERNTLEQDMERAIDLFPALGQRMHQLAGTMSGGEQQMLAMARACMRQPRLLCIDEPSMGLSPRYVDIIYDVIGTLKSSGVTILMVEQSANKALEVADRAYVLQNGRVVLSGTARDLVNNPTVRVAYLGEEVAAST